MKGFMKVVLGSMVGFILVFLFLFLILAGVAGSLGKKSKVKVEPNSILHINFSTDLPDRTHDSPFGSFGSFGADIGANMGLFDMINAIEHAKNDDKIKGLYLTTDYLSESFASLDQLRRVLMDFKSEGKFITAFNNFSTQKGYLIATVADELYLHPTGMFEFDGLAIETMYFKKLLDKLEIEPISLYAGDYKSASEPFRVTEMNDANRVQLKAILEDLYDNYLETIANARNKSKDELVAIADALGITEAKDAVDNGLVDALKYEDEVFSALKEKMGYEEDKKINFVTISDYVDSYESKASKAKEKIAVIYAEGSIVFGEGQSDQIGGEKFMKLIRKVRKDEKIKAIVLRVNSGGGSAFASEQMYRELVLAKAEKPLVVSMGNYAASGGYYIAAMADKIYAEKNTITGSIGVVGVLLNFEEFFENKIGVTYDRERTGEYADFGNLNRDWTDREMEVAEHQVKTIYMDFKERVAEGRNMTVEAVEEIAQGRVWTGQDAIDIGLVDEIGDLQMAIEKAAELANLEDYKLKDYPQEKEAFEQIMEMLSVDTDKVIKAELGVFYKEFEAIKKLEEWSGIQARIPFEIEIN